MALVPGSERVEQKVNTVGGTDISGTTGHVERISRQGLRVS